MWPLSVVMQSCTVNGGRLITGCRGLSPADSPCTGQNAETRSNGAALGRPMMLFLTPILNMPGAAGFSSQGSLLLYERQETQAESSFQADKDGLDLVSQKNNPCQIMRFFLSFLYQSVSFPMNETVFQSSKLQPVGFFLHFCFILSVFTLIFYNVLYN